MNNLKKLTDEYDEMERNRIQIEADAVTHELAEKLQDLNIDNAVAIHASMSLFGSLILGIIKDKEELFDLLDRFTENTIKNKAIMDITDAQSK